MLLVSHLVAPHRVAEHATVERSSRYLIANPQPSLKRPFTRAICHQLDTSEEPTPTDLPYVREVADHSVQTLEKVGPWCDKTSKQSLFAAFSYTCPELVLVKYDRFDIFD